ncbi:hypothetical protein M8J76_013307 [Diaphorina citri]|nr:hypothetical protein M8J76_013307 [Diaphorina citri]
MMTKVNINCEQTTGNLSTSLNQWTTPRNENLIKKEQETMTIYDADYIHLNHPPNLFDINKSLILQPRESNILNSSEEKLIIFTLFTFFILLMCSCCIIMGLIIAIIYLVCTKQNNASPT